MFRQGHLVRYSLLKKSFSFLILFLILETTVMAKTSEADLTQFRTEYEQSLRDNWLVVVGLSWLQEGANQIGSAATSQIHLPSTAPAHLGQIYFSKTTKGKTFEIEFTTVQNVKLDEHVVVKGKRYLLATDESGAKPTVVTTGTTRFYLIDRAHGVGVRIKDTESSTLKNFKGVHWWDANPSLRIVGQWQKFTQTKTIYIPDALGESSKENLEGNVVFNFKGQKYELFPTRNGDDLFFVFRDLTSGKSSYGTGRFLNAKVAANGEVVLDFNRAHNPPCAFISFATCPFAPKENNLPFAVEAGEKKPEGDHH